MHQTQYPRQAGSEQRPLFEIRSLSYRYPDGQPALREIDLTIHEGDRVALVGHNGAGKTTLIKHLGGLYRPQQGTVLYKGIPLEGNILDTVRLEVGILFQDPDDQLFCNTLYEDIAFGPMNQRLEQEEVDHRVRHAVRKVALETVLYKAPHHLSYGQKKRAALAAVLSMRPQVLILDEPTANLDSRQERLFWELFQDFPGTLIVISHDLAFMYGICDRAVVLEQGKIHHDYVMKELVSQRAYLRAHGLDFTFRFDTHAHPHASPEGHSHRHMNSVGHSDTHSHPYPDLHSHSEEHIEEAPTFPSRSSRSEDEKEGSAALSSIPDISKEDIPSTLLLLHDYSYRYPDGTWGLRNVSFTVREGENVAIVGENGAGKSTLARCLMGIIAGMGRHELDGKPITPKNRSDLWRHLGMVFQNPSDQLFCPSCQEEVAFGPRQMGLPPEEVKLRTKEALEAVRLTGYEHRVPHHLSAGERKRLAIAAVLGMKPRVLILDEPTAHLDQRSEELLVEILQRLDITKILISHDMPLIMALCRRTVVLHEGKIIRDYESAELQHDEHLISINGLDYTYKNACCREIMALQQDFEAGQSR